MATKHDKPIPHKTTGKGKTYNPTEKGAGMTAKGRAEYNAKNNANLKPPAPNPKTDADKARKASFCSRMTGVVKNAKGPAERAKASLEKLELLMADYPQITGTIRPTPRNRVSGFLADLLELGAKGYDVGSTLQAGGPITEGKLSTPVSDLLGVPELQRTLNRISYNEPLTTGTGYTTKLRPDTVSAAMTVAPGIGPTAKAGAVGARMAGTALKDLATSDVAYNAAMNAMKRSGAVLGMADDKYRGSHLAPNAANYGAYLHDLSGIIPKDVYTVKGKSLYGLGDSVVDREWWMTAMKAKGKPDADVTIYRAVPKGVQNINSGDWVTTSKRYAENHGESALSGDYEIISKTVKAKDLSTAGDPQEYGYHPIESQAK